MNEGEFIGTGGGGGDFEYEMYRRNAAGDIEKQTVDFNDYVHPPKGKAVKVVLNGRSPYYVTNTTFEGVTRPVTRTRAEYRIVKLAGDANNEYTGKLFAQQFPIPNHIDHPKAKLGQFIAALLNRPIRERERIVLDEFIGTEFVTNVTRDEDGDKIYCGISWDTIDPSKTKLSPYVNGVAKADEPELVSVAAAVDPDDPFESDDDL